MDSKIKEFIIQAMYSAKSEDGFIEMHWEQLKDILDLIDRKEVEIERLQADEATKVRYGCWKKVAFSQLFRCSLCGQEIYFGTDKFCKKCGATMYEGVRG